MMMLMPGPNNKKLDVGTSVLGSQRQQIRGGAVAGDSGCGDGRNALTTCRSAIWAAQATLQARGAGRGLGYTLTRRPRPEPPLYIVAIAKYLPEAGGQVAMCNRYFKYLKD